MPGEHPKSSVMSPATGLSKHSRRCLATQAHAPALWGGVAVFTGPDLATVIYAKHSRVQSKLHVCWK